MQQDSYWCTSKFPVPILFLYAGKDKVASAHVNAKVAEQIQQDDKTVICCEQDEHEILNEMNRVKTYDTIQKWILDRTNKNA